MAEKLSKYSLRGVSATKDDVHEAIKSLDKGLFPNAFCKVIPDLVGNDPLYCNVMHADTAGTKTSLAYLYWKELGDSSVWKGIVEDAIAMNIDDMACVGIVDNIVLSSTIGRNKNLISGEILSIIINYTQEYLSKLAEYGVNITLSGGETADVGDIVRTIDVGFTTFARLKRSEIIDVAIRPGDYIVGFASYGQSIYESQYNGGMGSNGLTSSRHDLLVKEYAEKYPESFDPLIPKQVVYSGSKRLEDKIVVDGEEINIGKLLLSPTRTYLPLLHRLVELYRQNIHGLIHCSGGGQTKVSRFLDVPCRVVKDNLLTIPPLFQLIQEESKMADKDMFQVFNMGHRLECYTHDKAIAEEMIEISKEMKIEAQIIGRVEPASTKEIIIDTGSNRFAYDYSL